MINPGSQYPPPATGAPTTDYPYGNAQNESSPGALDGFPLEEVWVNDWLGFTQSMIRATGVAPSGSAEKANLSQLLKTMQVLATSGNFFDDNGAADAYTADPRTNQQGPESYVDGMEIQFEAANTNTGASTINVNSLGIKNIDDLQNAGDITAGDIVSLRYDSGAGAFKVARPSIRSGKTVTVDDEGTWTPTNGGDATGVISNAFGKYIKQGKVVTVQFSFSTSNAFTGVTIGGLPFAPKNASTAVSSVHGVSMVVNTDTGDTPEGATLQDGLTTFSLTNVPGGAAVIRGFFTYITA